MSLSILNNIPSLEAQNQLAMTNTNLQNTLFQLSSGSKINSGADDPAGLSIADGLQANISALTQSAQNVTDGVGMLQTADGALSQVTTLLNRAVTLATEAANTGLTQGANSQQAALQNEFASITAEINQIGSNTTYNNTAVFSGNDMSVFLSDGSRADSQDPNISVYMPTLSASSLGLASYATGTLDVTNNPTAGNTVTIGTQTYTFEATASAANQVALGGNVQSTLQNLQSAVNGTGLAGIGTYGVGTAINQSATITSVNGGSAVVQALNAGTAGNNVPLVTNFTSTVGAGGGTTLSGGVNATNSTGTLTLNANPGTISTATASLNMTALPDTVTTATGSINLTALPTAGQTVTVGGQTYRFESTMAAANDVQIDGGGSVLATLQNLQDAVNGTGTSGTNWFAGTAAAGTALITGVTGNASAASATVTATTAGVGVSGSHTGNFTVLSSNITGAVAPTGLLSGGANADTVTIGAQTYTFVAPGQAAAANEVAEVTNAGSLAANIAATLANLQGAVNGSSPSLAAGINTWGVGSSTANTATITNISSGVATLTAATQGAGAVVAGGLGTGMNVNLAVNSATGTLTAVQMAGGANADTVTIGNVVYTFMAPGLATSGNEVAVGTGGTAQQNIQATLANLKSAVNAAAIGAGANGTYNVATVNTGASLAINPLNADQAILTTLTAGANTTTPLTAAFAGGANTGAVSGSGDLAGGANASAASGNLVLNANPLNGNTVTIGAQTYTFVTAAPSAANQVQIGGTINGTLTNLADAVGQGAGTAGVNYGVGTPVNSAVTINVSGNQATITAATAGAGTQAAGTGNYLVLSANLSSGVGGGTVGTVGSDLSGGGASVDLNSPTDSESALTTIAAAIATVASQRGAIGSGINQMNAALNVMNNTSQNLTSSLSGIQDANIGQVVAAMSKYQVLEQTGIAALAQANSQEQAVLKLLG